MGGALHPSSGGVIMFGGLTSNQDQIELKL